MEHSLMRATSLVSFDSKKFQGRRAGQSSEQQDKGKAQGTEESNQSLLNRIIKLAG